MNLDYFLSQITRGDIALLISFFSLGWGIFVYYRENKTRKIVKELNSLEIEKLKAEKERLSKAIVYGYIEDDFFVIENSGEAPASNIRYEGWDDWNNNISHNMINYLPPHHKHSIELYLTMDSPSSNTFKIMWDDDSGKDHVWSNTLDLE